MCNRSLRTSALALAGILIAIGGCSDQPSSPAASWQALSRNSSAARFDVSGSSASAVIGATGGTLVTSAGDRITFPVGALSQPTQITITSSASDVGVQILPHGLHFAVGRQPVLTLNTSGSNAGTYHHLNVSYVDDGGNITEVLEASVGSGALTATLPHFSGLLGVGS
jgi:hypothetical protein